MLIFVLILLKPITSDIFCDDCCQEAMDHKSITCSRIIRETNFRLHFVQFQYTLMWFGIKLYSNVGRCLQLN